SRAEISYLPKETTVQTKTRVVTSLARGSRRWMAERPVARRSRTPRSKREDSIFAMVVAVRVLELEGDPLAFQEGCHGDGKLGPPISGGMTKGRLLPGPSAV